MAIEEETAQEERAQWETCPFLILILNQFVNRARDNWVLHTDKPEDSYSQKRTAY